MITARIARERIDLLLWTDLRPQVPHCADIQVFFQTVPYGALCDYGAAPDRMQLQSLKSEIPEERSSPHVVFIVVVQMLLNRSLKSPVRISIDLFVSKMGIDPWKTGIFREDPRTLIPPNSRYMLVSNTSTAGSSLNYVSVFWQRIWPLFLCVSTIKTLKA